MDITVQASFLPHDGPGRIPPTTSGAIMTGSCTQGFKPVRHPVSDLSATVTDPDGNVLGLLQDR